MLVSLHVENIAVIKSLTLDMTDSFTVLTGETGAGKSILIDSILLLCGARSERELIRSGSDFAFVEGVFSVGEKTRSLLEEQDVFPDEDGIVVISRKITSDGRGVAKINDRTVTASKLREISTLFVNVHGQQDTAAFRTSKSCEEYLDSFSNSLPLIESYRKEYNERKNILSELSSLKKDMTEKAEQADFYRFRIQELDQISPVVGEEEELKLRRKYIANIDNINRACGDVSEYIYDGSVRANGMSAIEQITESVRALERVRSVLPEAEDYIERLNNVRYELEDVAESARSLVDTDLADSEKELDIIEERLMKLSELKRKYGSIEQAIAEKEKMISALDRLENNDELIKELEEKLKKTELSLEQEAQKLTKHREEHAKLLETRVQKELNDLDMEKTVLKVELVKKEYTETGSDDVRFLISPNVGEEPKPLGKIASGGELSRIMLALKTILCDDRDSPVMIFDEIDTGISGKTSQKIGIKLKNLAASEDLQVVCITHSAQIAALANTHVKISKEISDGRTQTLLTYLDEDQRITELARLIGGINIGTAIIEAARQLRNDGKNI